MVRNLGNGQEPGAGDLTGKKMNVKPDVNIEPQVESKHFVLKIIPADKWERIGSPSRTVGSDQEARPHLLPKTDAARSVMERFEERFPDTVFGDHCQSKLTDCEETRGIRFANGTKLDDADFLNSLDSTVEYYSNSES